MAEVVPLDKSKRSPKHLVPRGELHTRGTGQVQSLTRALRIMNTLADYPHGLTLSDLAHVVGLPTSTAHRLLTTLQNERYVRFENDRSIWLIGVQAFQVGAVYARSRDLVSIARPYMRRLMEESGETVNLAIVDRGEIIFLAQVECQKMMRAIAGPGGRSPIHCSGTGKAILAWLDQSEARGLLTSKPLQKETPNSKSTVGDLEAEFLQTCRSGYAIDDEENAIGLRCVASAVFDEHSYPLAAISVSGPAARLTDTRLPALGANVALIAAEITSEMGGLAPNPRTD